MNKLLALLAAPLLALAPALAAAQAPAAAPIASQETNWPGIVADVTEFKRKGNTLTAKLKLRYTGTEKGRYEFQYPGVYVLDAAAGKKYQVLKDDADAYVAATNPGWLDRISGEIQPGQSAVVWMKFPAPPAECKEVTLNVGNMAPFEDLPIQDM